MTIGESLIRSMIPSLTGTRAAPIYFDETQIAPAATSMPMGPSSLVDLANDRPSPWCNQGHARLGYRADLNSPMRSVWDSDDWRNALILTSAVSEPIAAAGSPGESVASRGSRSYTPPTIRC